MAAAEKSSRTFRGLKGTRDFYPQDMAVRRYIEGVWRQTSINHGFDEVEGPMFEDIELYKRKSGPGIVSEIFQVFSGKDEKELAAIRGGGDAPFALRPEFTPTLARMVAAKAAELPRPIKWFAIPQHFRAERPQRGRLREFLQWNVDYIGDDSPEADAEIIETAIGAFRAFKLESKDITVRISHRGLIEGCLQHSGVSAEDMPTAVALIDKRDRIAADEFLSQASSIKLDMEHFPVISGRMSDTVNNAVKEIEGGRDAKAIELQSEEVDQLIGLLASLHVIDALRWCEVDFSIVRGLAYYTGTVFEIHEASGEARAIAGGGRYDNLIESFGGPSLPACGFGMGDVVLANLLHDKNLLPEDAYMKPLRPHAFAIAASDEAEAKMRQTVAQLRREGFHVRHSYKTTRNVGKLMGDASKSRALSAIIFGKDIAEDPPRVDFKDLQSGSQEPVAISALEAKLKEIIARNE